MTNEPLLTVCGIEKRFGNRRALRGVSFEVYPGEVVGVVGESGSGKTTLLRCCSGDLPPEDGRVVYASRSHGAVDLAAIPESVLRRLSRTELGVVWQNPRDGLRMAISAGGNVGERLMAQGLRHFGAIRSEALAWLARVEMDPERVDDPPKTFSGGMQQRLQIARALVTRPRLVFLDEPTSGLDVSVQARLLDLLRGLVRSLGLAMVLVTHDLAVARLLCHRLMVMKEGEVVESGLTDRVLDDPFHPYTQQLVTSVLHP